MIRNFKNYIIKEEKDYKFDETAPISAVAKYYVQTLEDELLDKIMKNKDNKENLKKIDNLLNKHHKTLLKFIDEIKKI